VESIDTPNVFHRKRVPEARSGAGPLRNLTREALGYHEGQSAARISHAQATSHEAARSISFVT
jgi:hypothetical protein